MKIFTYIQIALVMLLVGGLASCSENDYWDGATTQEGYTFNANSQSFTFTNNDVFETVEIPVTRSTTKGEATLPITATFSSDKVSGPASVTFADGQNTANYVITCKGFDMGDEETAILEFDNSLVSTSGKDSTHVSILLDYVWNSIGEGKFNDAFWFEDNYDVEFLQNETYPNRYRLVKPYAGFIESEGATASSSISNYLEFWVLSKGDVVRGQTCPTDGLVYFPDCNTGYHYDSYDADVNILHPSKFTSLSDPSNWTYSKVLSTQENGMPAQVQLAPYEYMYGVGGWNYTQYNGVITITFPGVKIYDYSVSLKYTGRTIDTDDNESVNATIGFGADVAYAKVAVVPGDAESALNAMLSGSIEGTEITAAGDYSLPLTDPVSGTYTVIVIGYSADGEAQSYDYANFKYTAGVQETWTAIGTGDYTYKIVFANEDGTPYVDSGLTLYQNDQDQTKFKIEHWGYDVDFTFTMDADGNVLVDEQETGAETDNGALYVLDLVTAAGSTQYGQSSYDKSTGTFTFAVYYADAKTGYGYGYETFVLNSSAAKKSFVRPSVSLKAQPLFNNMKIKKAEKQFKLNGILNGFKK